MYSHSQLPPDLERYVQQARRMRSEYLAGLLRRGFAALARAARRVARGAAAAKPVARRTLVER